jgi:2-polyprenyl-3-methyl-5-hydroxy-6-metoxy-1,4-benzoquinol methylase
MPQLSDDMVAGATTIRRRRLGFQPAVAPLRGSARIAHVFAGLVLFPFYWAAGALLGVPGMQFRWKCFAAGVRLLFARGHLADAYRCIVSPMDSVRHFEMDFFWKRALDAKPRSVLDVSSPRLFTLLLLHHDRNARADLINPDGKDLARTHSLAQGLGVDVRCRFLEQRVEAMPRAETYSLVVCMSVLEHIVDDLGALRTMWEHVAPGGRLLLSVPCAATALEEETNVDEYGLLDRDGEGFVFWQRYYDESRLQALFAITGQPVLSKLYAERIPGAYDDDVLAKRTNPRYPHWREPFATARAYAYRDNVATLSGMGVVAMEFAKPAAADQ